MSKLIEQELARVEERILQERERLRIPKEETDLAKTAAQQKCSENTALKKQNKALLDRQKKPTRDLDDLHELCQIILSIAFGAALLAFTVYAIVDAIRVGKTDGYDIGIFIFIMLVVAAALAGVAWLLSWPAACICAAVRGICRAIFPRCRRGKKLAAQIEQNEKAAKRILADAEERYGQTVREAEKRLSILQRYHDILMRAHSPKPDDIPYVIADLLALETSPDTQNALQILPQLLDAVTKDWDAATLDRCAANMLTVLQSGSVGERSEYLWYSLMLIAFAAGTKGANTTVHYIEAVMNYINSEESEAVLALMRLIEKTPFVRFFTGLSMKRMQLENMLERREIEEAEQKRREEEREQLMHSGWPSSSYADLPSEDDEHKEFVECMETVDMMHMGPYSTDM